MKNVVNNLREGARIRQSTLLLPLILIPIGLMGVTTPSILKYRSADLQEKAAKDGSEYALDREQEWYALGDVGARVADIDELNSHLIKLIPDWQEELVVHGAVRDAARSVRLDLSRVFLATPIRNGVSIGDSVVVERAITLTGQGPATAAQDMVDQLRAEGWPTAVHSVSANLDTSQEGRFGYDIQLGVFHYAPSADFPEEKSDEALPMIEEPIQ